MSLSARPSAEVTQLAESGGGAGETAHPGPRVLVGAHRAACPLRWAASAIWWVADMT
jgi:hypothetical protein